jgi:hypothetical protein
VLDFDATVPDDPNPRELETSLGLRVMDAQLKPHDLDSAELEDLIRELGYCVTAPEHVDKAHRRRTVLERRVGGLPKNARLAWIHRYDLVASSDEVVRYPVAVASRVRGEPNDVDRAIAVKEFSDLVHRSGVRLSCEEVS